MEVKTLTKKKTERATTLKFSDKGSKSGGGGKSIFAAK